MTQLKLYIKISDNYAISSKYTSVEISWKVYSYDDSVTATYYNKILGEHFYSSYLSFNHLIQRLKILPLFLKNHQPYVIDHFPIKVRLEMIIISINHS